MSLGICKIACSICVFISYLFLQIVKVSTWSPCSRFEKDSNWFWLYMICVCLISHGSSLMLKTSQAKPNPHHTQQNSKSYQSYNFTLEPSKRMSFFICLVPILSFNARYHCKLKILHFGKKAPCINWFPPPARSAWPCNRSVLEQQSQMKPVLVAAEK